jgi:hypothetical protein
MTEPETVYTPPCRSGRQVQVVHTDLDCPRLQSRRSTKRRRQDYPDTPICQWCAGEVEQVTNQDQELHRQLEDMDADSIGGRS